jgi:hypothetical protein
MELTEAEREIAAQAGVSEEAARRLKGATGAGPLRRLVPSFGLDPLAAVAAPVSSERVDAVLEQLRPRMEALGHLAFLAHRGHGLRGEPDQIAVLRSSDPYDILRAVQTDGANYEVYNDDLITRLKAWEAQCAFRIVGADGDWVELEFLTLPTDLAAFAEEVYAFCPDTIDQGFYFPAEQELMEAEQVEDNSAVLLAILRDLQVVSQGASKEGSLERLAEVAEWHASVPATVRREEAVHKRALEMLAASIKKDRRLFLWWD